VNDPYTVLQLVWTITVEGLPLVSCRIRRIGDKIATDDVAADNRRFQDIPSEVDMRSNKRAKLSCAS
jgi:hypothetical protein